MKFLFWILAILSVPVGLFVSIISYATYGLGLTGTAFGDVVCIVGVPAVVVCVACTVFGIIKLRKGDLKKACVFALVGVIYCAIIGVGMVVDTLVDNVQLKNLVEELNNEQFGEGWDSPPAIEGIPELYQEVLNKFYATVCSRSNGDVLMDLGAVPMAEHYGDVAEDNIGFALMDLNGDKVDELVIGTVASAEGEATTVFCIYSDPENPFYSICAVEGEGYYLHAGETDSSYVVEHIALNSAWVITPAETENTFDFMDWESPLDPAGRLTLDLIPFSRYK